MADRAVALAVELGLEGSSRLLQPRLGSVCRASGLVCRGRPRRQRASRLVRGPARVSHQAARPHRRRDAPGRHSRRRPRRDSSRRGAWDGRSRRATSTAGSARSRILLDDDRRLRGGADRRQAAQDELAWSRAAAPLADLIDRVASSPPRTTLLRTMRVLLRAAATLARSSLGRRGLRATLAAASGGQSQAAPPALLGWRHGE